MSLRTHYRRKVIYNYPRLAFMAKSNLQNHKILLEDFKQNPNNYNTNGNIL